MNEQKRILIVDDDESSRSILSLMLERAGYETETAGTGQEALDKAQEKFFNLILLDIMLPDVKGTELLATLKEMHPDTAVIMATAYASLETAVQALNKGASAYITKPLYVDEVLATVGEALEKQHLVMENRRLYQETQRELAERRRAEETLRRYAEQLEALREVGLELTAELDLDTLLHSIVSRAIELLGGIAGGLYLYRPDREVLEWAVAIGPNVAPVGIVLHPGEGLSGKVLKTGESLIVDDYQHWEGYPITAIVSVPVRWGEEFLGVLNVQAPPPRTFSPADAELLRLFATQAAIAIHNARLFTSLAREKERLDLLHRLSHNLSESLDVYDVAQRALDDICAVLGASRGVVLVREPRGDRLHIVAVSGYDAESVEELDCRTSLRVGDGLAGWVATQRQPALVDDVSQDERWRTVSGMDEWVRSALSVPLISRGELVGVVNIYSNYTSFFNDDHRRLAESAAATVAAAVANARLYGAERQRRQEAETLREAALVLTTALDRNEVVEHILAQLQKVVPYDSASVQLFKGDWMEIVGGRGFPNLPDLPGISFPAGGDNPNSKVIRTRAPFIVEDGPAVYEEFQREPHAQAGIRSWLGVPMLVGEQLVGMIALDKHEPGFYVQEHARLAEAFAAQAAIAIENSRLFQAEREQRELAKALEEAAAAVSSTLHPDQVLDHILEQVERVVAGDAFNIMLVEDSTTRIVRFRGYERMSVKVPVPRVTIPIDKYPSLLKMMQTGKPVVIPDTVSDPDWIPVEGQEWRRSYVAAPIRVKDSIVGFLNVNSARPGQFGPSEARRLQVFADHAATAIENAQLYQELRNHAERLEERVQERTAQLQAQYARLETILDSTTDGIIVTNTMGEVIQTNPVAHTWLTQTLSPEDAARLRRAVQNLARQAATESAGGEAAAAGATSGKRPKTALELKGLDLELIAAPISLPPRKRGGREGEEAAAVVAVHDVSHLKALDRMKTRFVSNVSHELRTPITTIKLYAELMKRMPVEKWEKYLGVLAQEADRQARLVEDILQISRIDAGRMELHHQAISLNELVEIAVASHQVLAGSRNLTLEYQPAEVGTLENASAECSRRKLSRAIEPPVVLADQERMIQVLNNLVENSIYYTPEGGRVMVSIGKKEIEGHVWATATVADTGMGIPEEELPYIFERFFRGEGPQQMQTPGTGLGLAIAKEIVELHGGRVTVESQTDVGTAFTVWLPLVD